MQKENVEGLPKASASPQNPDSFALAIKMSYHDCNDKTATESTVIWIGKDSESEPNQYLEECNTHQSGE